MVDCGTKVPGEPPVHLSPGPGGQWGGLLVGVGGGGGQWRNSVRSLWRLP